MKQFILIVLYIICISIDVCGRTIEHIVLDRNRSFVEQVIDSNRVYEITSDFSISKTFEIPRNCTLMFNGGHLNGTDSACLVGNNTHIDGVSISLRNVLKDVAIVGTFNNEESSFSWWGAYREDSTKAVPNGRILKYLLTRSQEITFDGEYYVSLGDVVEVDHPISFRGGIIHWVEIPHSHACIKPIEGFSFFAKDVIFYNTWSHRGWLNAKDLTFVIDTLKFENCSFISGRRSVTLSFADLDLEHKVGINKFSLRDCHIDDNSRCFTISDGQFFDTLDVQGNQFRNFREAPIYLASTNSKKYATMRMKNSCVARITNNRFVCDAPCKSNAIYHCSVVAELNEVVFERNYIEGIASVYDGQKGPHTCYDAYLSCNKVLYRDNTIRNVMGWRTDGLRKQYNNRPQTEIFKSKSASISKIITGNIFEIDSAWIQKNQIPDSDNWIGIFVYQRQQDNLIFENNVIKIPNTRLEGRVAVNKGNVINATLRKNHFEAKSIRNLVHNGLGKNITITNNIFKTVDSPIGILRISKKDSNFDDIIVRDNDANNSLSMEYSNISTPNVKNFEWDTIIKDSCISAGTTYLYSGSGKCRMTVSANASGNPNYQFRINEKSKTDAVFRFLSIPQSFCILGSRGKEKDSSYSYTITIEMIVKNTPVQIKCTISKQNGVIKYKINNSDDVIAMEAVCLTQSFNGVKMELKNEKLYISRDGLDMHDLNTDIKYIITNNKKNSNS